MAKWHYLEMGSINKKNGKIPKYKVIVEDYKIVECGCPARSFKKYTPCKHMKSLHSKLTHLTI